MMRSDKIKLLFLIGVALWLASFFLPAYPDFLKSEGTLRGFECYFLNLGIITVIDSFSMLMHYVFTNITNLLVLYLIYRIISDRPAVKWDLFVGILTWSSSIYWVFVVEDISILKFGFWLWNISILMLAITKVQHSVAKKRESLKYYKPV